MCLYLIAKDEMPADVGNSYCDMFWKMKSLHIPVRAPKPKWTYRLLVLIQDNLKFKFDNNLLPIGGGVGSRTVDRLLDRWRN